MKISIFFYLLILMIAPFSSCKKLVQISPPVNSITTQEVFTDSSDANSAILGIYAKVINQSATGFSFGSGDITYFCGISSDELIPWTNSGSTAQLYLNQLTSTSNITDPIWKQAYPIIYQANANLEGLKASNTLSAEAKNQFEAEAIFLRALCYFYLINLYGDVPYITSSDFQSNSTAGKTSAKQIYQYIIADLVQAEPNLATDYSMSQNNRTRVNRWGAAALLARLYLYTGDWANAAAKATEVITNSMYALESNLNNVFLKSSREAIFQLSLNTSLYPYNATPEGYFELPVSPTSPPKSFYITNILNAAFEPSDQRKLFWIDSCIYAGKKYYYPFKYKVGSHQASANTAATEYYMVLRLAEQYLIRAEAEAHGAGGGVDSAISDLNKLRLRAGLLPISQSSQADILTEIYHERQVELFAEWGNRWLDLKRTAMVDSVMSDATPTKSGGKSWISNQQLYPIPQSELLADPSLAQNPGY